MARPDTQTRLAIEMIRKRVRHADHAAYRLPGERGLAVELGLSRQTIRRAIDQLTEEGLLLRGETGRLSVNPALATDGRDPRPLVAFLNPGVISPETLLWRDGILGALANHDVVVRSLSYEHYSDPAISAALEGFDGIFFLPLAGEPTPSWLASRMVASRTRVVVLDHDESAAGLRSVIVFPFASGHKLLDHLRVLGHVRIDCFNIQPHNPVIAARIAVWREHLDRHRIAGELINHPADGSLEIAHRHLARWLQGGGSLGTALYCTTAMAAIGGIRAAHEHGLRIGSDLSVCAVNDEGFGPYLIPSLTSLQSTPRAQYLRKAATWLLTVKGWATPSLHQPGDAPLFIGESTGPAKR
ncbi:MAG: substrate-binding domain-containing protein [Burkholderiales bacterium]|nr:substrate-binding domain-containing protein [Opitutaceae bacterium]